MSYAALRARVNAAERAVATHMDNCGSQYAVFRAHLKAAMTPARLLGTGFLTGLLVGFTEPLAKLGGGMRLVQLATSVATFVGALEARDAAHEATDAADVATEVAVEASDAADTATTVAVAVDPDVAAKVEPEAAAKVEAAATKVATQPRSIA